MSDESERGSDSDRRVKSVPPATVPRPASRPPDGAAAAQANQPAPYPQHFRATTKMSADEIAAVIAETERAKAAAEFDPERTVVVDRHDSDRHDSGRHDSGRRDGERHDSDRQDVDPDEAPTVDYDPRVRGVYVAPSHRDRPPTYSSDMAGTEPTPQPISSEETPDDLDGAATVERPHLMMKQSESGRRRTSRRTVRIPDDHVRRAAPTVPDVTEAKAREAAAEQSRPPSLAVEEMAEPPTIANDPSTPGEDVAREIVEEITIVRPLRIINIGSDPPPPVTSAEAVWPPGPYVPSEPPPRHAVVDGPRAEVPSIAKTDLLPPPSDDVDAVEEGWTPIQAPVRETERAPADDIPRDDIPRDSAPELENSELLEEVEPDAAPIPTIATPKRPPPPPAKKVEPPPKPTAAEAKRAADAESDLRSTTIEPGPKKKPKPWFEDLFSEDYIKTMDQLAPEHLRLEVDFIEESLGVEKQAVVLDLACGRGEHAIELANRGYSVLGLDLSAVALGVAHSGAARMRPNGDSTKPSFIRADMRDLDFEENFDGAYCWSTSFGYFDDETNLGVLRKLYRALRQGGMLLIDVANRDFVAPRSPSLVWFEGDGCVCMDDMYVDFLTSRLRVKRTAMFEDGHSRELEYSIRLYSLSELGRMLHEVGFRVVEVTGHLAHPGVFFGTESPRLIVLAERN